MVTKCKHCGNTNSSMMMNKGQGRKSKSLCKTCHNNFTILRGRTNKQKYVDYKGGECIHCGYNKCIDALEFHHRDPNQKDLLFKNIRYWGLEKAKSELDKCDLVCCRCHREVHAGLR